MNRLHALREQGQAIWLDYISRELLTDGGLERLVREDGLSGVTSNPTIFEQAIGGSGLYDEEVRSLLRAHPAAGAESLYEELVTSDIRAAADILASVWEATAGADGYVSLEVSPHLALDTAGTIDQARHLWNRVARPNLMIKVPATRPGIPAIESLLAEGININITLMFSLAHYEAVAQAYLRAAPRAPDPRRLASVASFFVSRVDSKVDALLDGMGTAEAPALRGRAAIANSKLAYRRFGELFGGPAFAAGRAAGARPQRVLWASTSTKDPAYRDVMYVEELIGPETINTMPPKTLDAFRDHGIARPTLATGLSEAEAVVERLAALGVDLAVVTEELQEEGVEKFAQPFDKLLAALERKRAAILETEAVGPGR